MSANKVKISGNVYVIKTQAGWKSSYREFIDNYASADTKHPERNYPKKYPCVVIYDTVVFNGLHQTFLYNEDIKTILEEIKWRNY